MLNRYYVVILMLFTLTGAQLVKAQCLNPEWVSCFPSCTYVIGDRVSFDANGDGTFEDYEVSANPSFATFTAPPAAVCWTLVNATCESAGPPSVDVTEAAGEWCRTAFASSSVLTDGGATITQRGLVYSTVTGPTLSDNVIIDSENSTGDFTGLLDGLSPETEYFVRGYATNANGTTYSGTEASFTTLADVDCGDCALACDKSDPSLYNPTVIPADIFAGDTVCLTNDYTLGGNVTVTGTLKLCNNAQVTIVGAVNMVLGGGGSTIGQVIYEGCDERFIGTGSYQGYVIDNVGPGNDPQQMRSYCSSCDDGVRGQFLDNSLVIDFWAATCEPSLTVLPVELTTFTLSAHQEGVILNWSTSSEINNSHFLIQTSFDGTNWSTIGLVEGAGDSFEENNYSFIDTEISGGLQYYRLQQVDFDGSFANSNVRVYSMDGSQPNLVVAYQNGTNLEVSVAYKGVGAVNLYDSRGRLVAMQSYISQANDGAQFSFDVSTQETGIYYVHVSTGSKVVSTKVLIK